MRLSTAKNTLTTIAGGSGDAGLPPEVRSVLTASTFNALPLTTTVNVKDRPPELQFEDLILDFSQPDPLPKENQLDCKTKQREREQGKREQNRHDEREIDSEAQEDDELSRGEPAEGDKLEQCELQKRDDLGEKHERTQQQLILSHVRRTSEPTKGGEYDKATPSYGNPPFRPWMRALKPMNTPELLNLLNKDTRGWIKAWNLLDEDGLLDTDAIIKKHKGGQFPCKRAGCLVKFESVLESGLHLVLGILSEQYRQAWIDRIDLERYSISRETLGRLTKFCGTTEDMFKCPFLPSLGRDLCAEDVKSAGIKTVVGNAPNAFLVERASPLLRALLDTDKTTTLKGLPCICGEILPSLQHTGLHKIMGCPEKPMSAFDFVDLTNSNSASHKRYHENKKFAFRFISKDDYTKAMAELKSHKPRDLVLKGAYQFTKALQLGMHDKDAVWQISTNTSFRTISSRILDARPAGELLALPMRYSNPSGGAEIDSMESSSWRLLLEHEKVFPVTSPILVSSIVSPSRTFATLHWHRHTSRADIEWATAIKHSGHRPHSRRSTPKTTKRADYYSEDGLIHMLPRTTSTVLRVRRVHAAVGAMLERR